MSIEGRKRNNIAQLAIFGGSLLIFVAAGIGAYQAGIKGFILGAILGTTPFALLFIGAIFVEGIKSGKSSK